MSLWSDACGENFVEEEEKCTKKGNDKHEDADSLLHNTTLVIMFVPDFKILGREVPEKSLTEKMFTQRHMHRQTLLWKRQKLYTPINFVCRG